MNRRNYLEIENVLTSECEKSETGPRTLMCFKSIGRADDSEIKLAIMV